MKIYISIEDPESLESFVTEAQRIGLLKGIRINTNAFRKDDFPMQFPVDVEAFLKLTANPMVKKIYGKKIEATLRGYLLGTG